MKILVAEDSRVMRQIIGRALRQAGYGDSEIVEAVDGHDALNKIWTEQPDLVLADWHMPSMNGFDLLVTLRTAGDTRAFGFVTTEGSPQMRAAAEQAGAAFVIGKPFSSQSFEAALDQLTHEIDERPQATSANGLPTVKDVRDLLRELLERGVEAEVAVPWKPTPEDDAVVAEFVDDNVRLRRLVVLDLAAAVRLGAALGLLPAGGADEMIAEGGPAPVVLQNLHEVLNVLASLFNGAAATHVKLWAVHDPGARLPADVVDALRRLGGRLDLRFSIDGYGMGLLSLVATS